MRIAAISTLASGGAAAAAWRITRALADAGHECTCFALEGAGNAYLRSLANTEASDPTAPFWTSAFLARSTALVDKAKLTAGTEFFSDHSIALHPLLPLPEALLHADIVHLHWVAGMIFSPALLMAMRGKKVVWTLHDMNAFTGGCHYHAECKKFETRCGDCPMLRTSGPDDASTCVFALKKALYPSLAPSVVTPSRWLAGEASRSALLSGSSISTVPYSYDLEVFQPGDRTAQRHNLGLRRDSFVVALGVDYLDNPRKNAKALLDALRILAERIPDTSLEVLAFGSGELAAPPFPIIHRGRVDNETELAEIYSAADLYVLPSLLDNLPNTLCEAQCCGTPVLSFDAGGCAETMAPGKTGFLVREKTPAALADALEDIYRNREKLAPMREAARAFAVERFNPARVAAAYTEIFEQAVSAPGLAHDSPLFASLIQNQIASLASAMRTEENHILRLSSENHSLRLSSENHRLRLASLEAFCSAQAEQLESVRRELASMKQTLRHPLRWFIRKFLKKSAE